MLAREKFVAGLVASSLTLSGCTSAPEVACLRGHFPPNTSGRVGPVMVDNVAGKNGGVFISLGDEEAFRSRHRLLPYVYIKELDAGVYFERGGDVFVNFGCGNPSAKRAES